jgi:hypothetical protein
VAGSLHCAGIATAVVERAAATMECIVSRVLTLQLQLIVSPLSLANFSLLVGS